MIYELDVIDGVCTELERQGYVIVSKKREIRHSGIDIIAKKVDSDMNERFYIEAVGGTSSDPSSSRFGKPFDNSQCKVHVSEQLYACAKILSSPKAAGITSKVGIAFADIEYYRNYIDEIKNTLKQLGIEVLFVNELRKVRYL
ncbi:hypothetical protein QNH39_26245 [Neobacillus novalis]|uniref:Uncharacterized protein n=1 Tax=Neobacillus novalis TaxID=220687 RepID=A0AA95MPK8_9BACI|nr:hypothetical protein [Neobacillus novalis]WHY86034.1 hypothetical protein QNH39_26245 [Neobacillus novalis]